MHPTKSLPPSRRQQLLPSSQAQLLPQEATEHLEFTQPAAAFPGSPQQARLSGSARRLAPVLCIHVGILGWEEGPLALKSCSFQHTLAVPRPSRPRGRCLPPCFLAHLLPGEETNTSLRHPSHQVWAAAVLLRILGLAAPPSSAGSGALCTDGLRTPPHTFSPPPY